MRGEGGGTRGQEKPEARSQKSEEKAKPEDESEKPEGKTKATALPSGNPGILPFERALDVVFDLSSGFWLSTFAFAFSSDFWLLVSGFGSPPQPLQLGIQIQHQPRQQQKHQDPEDPDDPDRAIVHRFPSPVSM
jgi:hypothetical protein